MVVSFYFIKYKYRLLVARVIEVLWITSVLGELGMKLNHPPRLIYDNVHAHHMARNTVWHARIKHINLHYHFIHDLILKK